MPRRVLPVVQGLTVARAVAKFGISQQWVSARAMLSIRWSGCGVAAVQSTLIPTARAHLNRADQDH